MKYNVALLFDEETNKEIINYSKEINKNFDTTSELDEKSIPHITIFKFEAEDFKEELSFKPFKVTFSGLTLLPSKDGETWVEISVLKNKYFTEIIEKLSKLKNIKILNEIGDTFRPHITLSKIRNKKINIEDLDYSILRKKQVQGHLCLGEAKGEFKFSKI